MYTLYHPTYTDANSSSDYQLVTSFSLDSSTPVHRPISPLLMAQLNLIQIPLSLDLEIGQLISPTVNLSPKPCALCLLKQILRHLLLLAAQQLPVQQPLLRLCLHYWGIRKHQWS